MQKITPFLWFDNNAEEAMQFYTSVFNHSNIKEVRVYEKAGPNMDESIVTGSFQLEGQDFMALNGGPYFKFTPATSFFVNIDTESALNELWKKLLDGGAALMPLGKYPFSEKFGWVQDKYGISWQLNYADNKQKIVPFLMFTGKQHGKAEEAISFYTSLFADSHVTDIQRYGAEEQGEEGTVKVAHFMLNGQEFMAIDSNAPHQFNFSQAISFYVSCKTQDEIDMFWEKLSEGGEKQPCGWLIDKYGVTWQVVPEILDKMLVDKDPAKARRVLEAMMQMKKIEIPALQEAYDGVAKVV